MHKLMLWLTIGLAVLVIAGCAWGPKTYYAERPTSAKQLEASLGKSDQVVKQDDGSERWIYLLNAGEIKGRYFIIRNDRVVDSGII
ncbi:MAG: hypothetical protein M1418_01230 [Deltaproteobacteria bacterium]|nr:hypothetical protein [Deltaproteobacteria bacterium]